MREAQAVSHTYRIQNERVRSLTTFTAKYFENMESDIN